MNKRGVNEWIAQPKIKAVLLALSAPKTPRQIEKQLGIKKLKLKPFLEKGLVKSLNPDARKSRFYILTSKAGRQLNIPNNKEEDNKDWGLIGWIMASPRQRFVILKSMDSAKRTSEEIRIMASQSNQHLSRTSTKDILKELVGKELVEAELLDRRRYYWLTKEGLAIRMNLD